MQPSRFLRPGPGGVGMIRREKKPQNYPIENQYLQRLGNDNFRVGVALMQGMRYVDSFMSCRKIGKKGKPFFVEGLLFRDEMEDAHTACLSMKNHPDTGFFAVFDGHNGTLASLWAAKNVADGIDDLKEFTPESIREKMLELDAKYLSSTTDENSGATAVFATVSFTGDGYKMSVGNLGDSRCIIGYYGSNKFKLMTTDHKPDTPSEEARITAAGGIVARGRVDCHLAVARALGDGAYKKNKDLPPDKQKVVCVADVTEAVLSPEEFVFICCDGIFETFKNDEVMDFIYQRMQRTNDTAKILSELLTETLTRGSKDNMTAMIIECKEGLKFNKGDEFIPGNFYEKGNETWLQAYEADCKRYNKTLTEVKEYLARGGDKTDNIKITEDRDSSPKLEDNQEKEKERDRRTRRNHTVHSTSNSNAAAEKLRTSHGSKKGNGNKKSKKTIVVSSSDIPSTSRTNGSDEKKSSSSSRSTLTGTGSDDKKVARSTSTKHSSKHDMSRLNDPKKSVSSKQLTTKVSKTKTSKQKKDGQDKDKDKDNKDIPKEAKDKEKEKDGQKIEPKKEKKK